MKKPIIGITLDNFDPNQNEQAKWYSYDYWYALRSHYTEVVVEMGGIPFPLVHNNNLIPDFVEKIDGLIITGGGFDVPPSYYGEDQKPETRLKLRRSEFEKAMVLAFYQKQKPILGICGGMQLLAALNGGKLFQYLPGEGVFKEHTQDLPRNEAWHTITCLPNTQLASIAKCSDIPIPVNSIHQQGVKTAGKMIVSAVSDDYLIEGIEDPDHPFCIGVQWHPEFFVSDFDRRIFEHFMCKCG
jgi:putative glutamine amidotransferase